MTVDEEIEHLKSIVEAYEKLTSLSRDELLQATRTIAAHEKIAELSREEILHLRKELAEYRKEDDSQQQQIKKILLEDSTNEELILQELEALRNESDEHFYKDLFKVLVHYEFSDEEATQAWDAIETHKEKISLNLGRPVGFRVAMLDYFINQNKILHSPKIIEISLFDEVVKSSLVDDLTGLFNRRYFNQVFSREINRAQRHQRAMSLFIFDIDNFKMFNDCHGHAAGDEALRLIGAELRKSVRHEDIPCRYGGEEFAVLLPETGGPGADVVAQRFRANLEKVHVEGQSITVSGGIAHFPEHGIESGSLFMQADQALFKAKQAGKNQICLAHS